MSILASAIRLKPPKILPQPIGPGRHTPRLRPRQSLRGWSNMRRIAVRNGVVILSWQERIGSTIVHVLDLLVNQAHTFVTPAKCGFMRSTVRSSAKNTIANLNNNHTGAIAIETGGIPISNDYRRLLLSKNCLKCAALSSTPQHSPSFPLDCSELTQRIDLVKENHSSQRQAPSP